MIVLKHTLASTLTTILSAPLDEEEAVSLIKSTLETKSNACWRLLEQTGILRTHGWSVIHSCVADNRMDVIKKILPYCSLEVSRSLEDKKHLALQMCVDYEYLKTFKLIYNNTDCHTRKQKEDLLLLAWEKDAQKTNMTVEEIFAVQSMTSKSIANFLCGKMTKQQLRDLAGRIEDPNLWRHVGNIFEKRSEFQTEGKQLLGKWHNYINHVTGEIVQKERRRHL